MYRCFVCPVETWELESSGSSFIPFQYETAMQFFFYQALWAVLLTQINLILFIYVLNTLSFSLIRKL